MDSDAYSRNILLHFLNYDTQSIFALRQRFYAPVVETLLTEAIYLSVLLCKDYAFVPLGFVYESALTRRILKRLQSLASDGLIRISLRETDIVAYLLKKQSGYDPFKELPCYRMFFVKKPEHLFKELHAHLVSRETHIGSYCVDRWTRANADPGRSAWQRIYNSLESQEDRRRFQELMLTFDVLYRERPFIWPSVEKCLPGIPPSTVRAIRCQFEEYYYEAYISEGDVGVLVDLPFATTEFGLCTHWTPTFSYACYREWLKMIELDDYVRLSAPDGICRLRHAPEMVSLNFLYQQAVSGATSPAGARKRLASFVMGAEAKELIHALRSRLKLRRRVPRDERRQAMQKTLVLMVSANPVGTSRLALDEEAREIEDKIRKAEYRDSVSLVTKWASRPDDLIQALNQHRPHIVHFSGHGSASEEIILLDKDDTPKPVSKEALVSLFKTLRDNIRVVVLNACFSASQARAITSHIDCAIGMSRAIGDSAAITFAASFYRAIGFGRSVQEAFEQGKAALLLEGIDEDRTPKLLVRRSVDPCRVVLLRPSSDGM